MLKLIIADDERVIRETISSLIDWSSMNIALTGLCSNGLEAYDRIIDDCPDIVMTDIKMPGMNGLDLIKKTAEMNLDTQFIILSGYGEFEYAKEAMKYGVKHYILKPCNEKQIAESVLAVAHDCCDIKKRQVLALFQNLLKESTGDIAKLSNLIDEAQDIEVLKQLSNNLILETKLHNSEIAPFELTELIMSIDNLHSPGEILEKINAGIRKLISRPEKDTSTSFTKQIYTYVENHLQDSNLTLKEIAENQLYMNVDYVSKRFLKETGERFSDYLSEIRIRKAKQYLLKGYKIQEVAEKIGCGNNPHYFSQLFKKKTGMTPTTYISEFGGSANQEET